jgi:hypothetical protein
MLKFLTNQSLVSNLTGKGIDSFKVDGKRKVAKRKVTSEDMDAAGVRNNQDLQYFNEHGELPFKR